MGQGARSLRDTGPPGSAPSPTSRKHNVSEAYFEREKKIRRDSWLLVGREDDHARHGLELGDEVLDKGKKCLVDEEKTILSVVGDISDLLCGEPRVDRVMDGATPVTA